MSCRTYRTCVNSSGSSKAASGQSTHIKWADSTAHEPQARHSAHSRVCLLARISIRAHGLMEYTEQASEPSSPSLVQMQNAGDSRVSKCSEMDNRGGENRSPPPSLLSFVVNEVKLSYPPGLRFSPHPLSGSPFDPRDPFIFTFFLFDGHS